MRYLLSLSLLVLAFIANARQITPEEAQAAAQDFFNNSFIEQSRAPRAIRARALNTNQNEENAPYYVFNASDDKGFVIISGDDRAKKILGYSDKGNFDFANMPPQLSALLEQYAESLKNLSGDSADPSWNEKVYTSNNESGVLLETANWGQDYPYNAQCPVFDGVHAPTGCIATAMAIVMKYHNWPKVGKRENHYRLTLDGPEDQFHFDFSNYHPRWELIKDTYDASETGDETIKAISDLMMAAGIASHTNYFLNSGTTLLDAMSGLRRFLGFAHTLNFIEKTNISDVQWSEIIRQEINNNRPIICSGFNTDYVGHAFVIDGYSATQNDMIHINWGWDGIANGYFDINNSGFNFEQQMITGICKPDSDDNLYSDYYLCHSNEYPFLHIEFINISVENVISNQSFNLITPYILWPEHSSAKIGIALVDKNKYIKEVIASNLFTNRWEFGAFSRISSFANVKFNLPIQNEDRIQLVAQDEGEETWKYINSTYNIESSIPVSDNVPKTKSVNWEIDPRLYVDFFGPNGPTSWYPFYIKEPNKEMDPKMSYILYGFEQESHVRYGECDGKIICAAVRVNGKMRGSQIYEASLPYGDYLQFTIECDAIDYQQPFYDVEIMAIFEDDERESSNISVSTSNSVSEYCANHDCTYITKLKLSGDGYGDGDLRPIYNNMPFLMSLDLSEYKPKDRTLRPFVFSSAEDSDYDLPDDELEYFRGNPGVIKTGMQCLKELILPKDLESIKAGAFFLCSIDHLTIPKSVKYIGPWAFNTNQWSQANIDMKYVVCESPIPPEVGELGFGEIQNKNTILYVPKGSSDAYSKAPEWSKFNQIIEYEGEFNSIDSPILDKTDENVSIYDLSGLLVFYGKNSNVPELQKGVYIVKVRDKATKIIVL